MKKTFTLILFLLSQFSIAQINLVPNPSFEDTVACPDAGGQFGNAADWHVAENTPDYFNRCCLLPIFSVPDNTFSTRDAASGNAYCGFYTYSTVAFYREKISVELIQPLIIGTKYYVSAKISSVKTIINQLSNCATNKLSFRFSKSLYNLNYLPPTDNI